MHSRPMRSLRLATSCLAFACGSGCVAVQNRYSVFGFDGLQSPSPGQARFWSLSLLLGIAVISAVLGGLGFWLALQWRRWRRAPGIDARASEPRPVTTGAPVQPGNHA